MEVLVEAARIVEDEWIRYLAKWVSLEVAGNLNGHPKSRVVKAVMNDMGYRGGVVADYREVWQAMKLLVNAEYIRVTPGPRNSHLLWHVESYDPDRDADLLEAS
jgi:hypothetical protein